MLELWKKTEPHASLSVSLIKFLEVPPLNLFSIALHTKESDQ